MIIKAKNTIYKNSQKSQGVYLNLEIKDINTFYNRFDNTLNLLFGVFQTIENETELVDKIKFVFSDENKRPGYVQLEDEEGTGDQNMLIEEYFAQNGNLDNVIVEDYGMPSVELAKTFFTGGTFDDPEITPTNLLAKQWLLNTIYFDGKLIAENFEF